MKLVEIVRGLETNDETAKIIAEVANKWEKKQL